MMTRPFPRLLLSLAIVVAIAGRAAADCARHVDVCERINNDREIFTARIVAAVPGDEYTWRARVLHSYRGTAAGDVLVRVFSHNDMPSPADLEVGHAYLFYTSQDREDGRLVRTTPPACGDWLPLSMVSRDELAFLDRLGSRVADAHIAGTLVRALPGFTTEPVPGVEMRVTDRAKTAAATTDRDGRFEIRGLAAGTYRVTGALGGDLRLEGKTEIELVAHSCARAYLTTAPNTTISGRVILPLGIQVTGTQVTALAVNGRDVKSTYTDPFGRYQLSGLDPGDYIIGINAGQYPPRAAAPFPATYAPDTTDRATARIVHISGAMALDDVNITVARLSDIVTIRVRGTFEDGRPVTEQSLRLSTTGRDEYDVRTTRSADGVATISVLRGVPVYLIGLYLMAPAACLSPVRLGPDVYPAEITAIYTADGCRQMFNLRELGRLRASAPGDEVGVRVRVTFAGGAPADAASVSVVSAPGRGPYSAGFLTGKNGEIELMLPVASELRLLAAMLKHGPGCTTEAIVNTERGVRWILRTDGAHPDWDAVSPTTDVVSLVLEAAACGP